MSLSRAYSVLHVKSVDTDQRVFRGMATTPEVDRVGDIIEPKGAKFSNPLSLLLYHDHAMPVGRVKFSKPTDAGIEFEAHIPEVTEPGTLKDRVDEAWQSVKHGLIRGVSVGFRTLEDGVELMRSGGYRFTKIEILELSLVAVPANSQAVISTIKSIDAPYLAALGDGATAVPPHSSGVSDSVSKTARRTPHPMKTIAEQIKECQATRQAKDAQRTALMTKAGEAGVVLDDAQEQEYDCLDLEIKKLDAHLVRLEALEKSNIAAATAAVGDTAKAAATSRGGAVSVSDPAVPAGTGFARFVMAKVRSYAEHRPVLDIVKEMWPSHTALHAFTQKATVPAGNTTDAVWASPLVDQTNLAGEFIEYLRPRTIIGQLDLNKVPFNVRVLGQTSGGTGYWVGQGQPKPLTSFAFNATTMLWTKVAAISVITEELARFSSPSAEGLVRSALAAALIERIDVDFIDPANAGTANVKPASITNGVTALTSAGTSADNVRTDLMRLVNTFVASNQRGTRLALIMPDSLALGLSLMTNALGQPEFNGLTQDGGSLRGIKVVTSQYAANASGYGNLVVAVNQDEVFLADDGQVSIDVSREASLQMLDNPTIASNPPTPTTSVSMWQTNSIAIRAERFINWQKRRAAAVALLDDVNWGSVGSPS